MTTSNSGIRSSSARLLARLLLGGQLGGVAPARLLALDAEVEERRAEALDLLAHRRADVEAGDDGAEPSRRRDRLQAGDAGAEHEHLRGRDRPGRGHQEREEPRQAVGRSDDRLVARDRALGRERVHRLRPRDPGDRLHRERDDAALGESLDAGRCRPEARGSRSSTVPGSELGHVGGARRADTRDCLRALEQLAVRDDVRACFRVVLVGEAGLDAGARSTATSKPAATRRPTESGTSATRRSLAPVSFGTADPHGERTLRSGAADEEGNRSRPWKLGHCGLAARHLLHGARGSRPVSARPLDPGDGLRRGARSAARLARQPTGGTPARRLAPRRRQDHRRPERALQARPAERGGARADSPPPGHRAHGSSRASRTSSPRCRTCSTTTSAGTAAAIRTG